MKVSLPNDQWAVVISNSEITERQNRAILRAVMNSTGTTALLESQGFKDGDPSTYHVYSALSDEEKDSVNDVQTVLICSLVSSWSFDSPINGDSCLDLPQDTYQQLAMECLQAWKPTEVDMLDPKVVIAVLPG
jgi:hypothetical protein